MFTLMIRRGILPLVLLTIGTIVYAANPHFVGDVTVTDLGTTISATGKVAGLGTGDVTIVLSAQGIADVQCRNPAGKLAPGQQKQVEVGDSITLPTTKNGNVTFSLTTAEPDAEDACPNPKWTAIVRDVVFTGGTVSVLQGGVVILTQTF